VAATLLNHGADWACEVSSVSALEVAAVRGHRAVTDMLVECALRSAELGATSNGPGRRGLLLLKGSATRPEEGGADGAGTAE
jgi:hypothetical protein